MIRNSNRKPLYDYAPDCGCHSPRCNNGWITWNGSEYPCNHALEVQAKREATRKRVSKVADSMEANLF